ncbi:MAG: Crp/Fnr family transcriptional regulator [Porphyrobacter sp.]|nr:Crp/Fnr family transcriptional regulator [Porphyrobacter sp.]
MRRTIIDPVEAGTAPHPPATGDRTGHSEVDRYPRTGRFLLGRLRHAMSEKEKHTVESLVEEVVTLPPATTIIARGDLCRKSTMLIDGYMLRTIREGGRRFVVGINVPGDFVDLHGFALRRLDHDIVSLGATTIGTVPHGRLEEVMRTAPHLARLLWFATLLEAAIHREWIMRLERLTAARRVAHIFAELWYRLDLVGLGRRDGLRTPLIQADLADMCGTTAIHMNRVLGQLKKEGVAEFRRGTVSVPDRSRLERFADFDPTYLYGRGVLEVGDELDDVAAAWA